MLTNILLSLGLMASSGVNYTATESQAIIDYYDDFKEQMKINKGIRKLIGEDAEVTFYNRLTFANMDCVEINYKIDGTNYYALATVKSLVE
jgi:hypothetical protein